MATADAATLALRIERSGTLADPAHARVPIEFMHAGELAEKQKMMKNIMKATTFARDGTGWRLATAGDRVATKGTMLAVVCNCHPSFYKDSPLAEGGLYAEGGAGVEALCALVSRLAEPQMRARCAASLASHIGIPAEVASRVLEFELLQPAAPHTVVKVGALLSGSGFVEGQDMVVASFSVPNNDALHAALVEHTEAAVAGDGVVTGKMATFMVQHNSDVASAATALCLGMKDSAMLGTRVGVAFEASVPHAERAGYPSVVLTSPNTLEFSTADKGHFRISRESSAVVCCGATTHTLNARETALIKSESSVVDAESPLDVSLSIVIRATAPATLLGASI